MNIDELTIEELKEIKYGLNEILRYRYTYKITEKNLKRRELNEKYIKMDNKLIKMFIEEIDNRKEDK